MPFELLRRALATPLSGCAVAIALASCGEPERVFDHDRAYRHLVTQVEFGPRNPGSEGHDRALSYCREHLEGVADQVLLHQFEAVAALDSSQIRGESVIAVFNPESPVRILFGAHWDTRAVADREAGGRVHVADYTDENAPDPLAGHRSDYAGSSTRCWVFFCGSSVLTKSVLMLFFWKAEIRFCLSIALR